MAPVQYILTDIEGTTTSVSFVYDVLFPYFRNNIQQLKKMVNEPEVQEAFEQTRQLAFENEGKSLESIDEIITQLESWSLADLKITPLKTLQGIVWKKGYASGEIKGHVYPDVAPSLERWKANGIQLGVFSSGSVAAQKLIFGYSEAGDLTPFFSHYFDTKTGGKREVETYRKIASEIDVDPENCLFLSDITEELEAAKAAGFQTTQLLRPETFENWPTTAKTFLEIGFKN